jgi:hypothetical protein
VAGPDAGLGGPFQPEEYSDAIESLTAEAASLWSGAGSNQMEAGDVVRLEDIDGLVDQGLWKHPRMGTIAMGETTFT